MMYSEFVEGTGCKQNEHNYKVFCNLEAMYMNTDMTKQEIYEYGKKLVDNSKSEQQLKLEETVLSQIKECKSEIARYEGYVEMDSNQLSYWKEQGDKEMMGMYRNSVKFYKNEIRMLKGRITELKWVLE